MCVCVYVRASVCTIWRTSFDDCIAVMCVLCSPCSSTKVSLTFLSQDQTLDREPANSVKGFLMLHFLWFLAADTNNGRIALATETNRKTPEASSWLYKNTSKEAINRQFLGLQNCRRYAYVQYHFRLCFVYQYFNCWLDPSVCYGTSRQFHKWDKQKQTCW